MTLEWHACRVAFVLLSMLLLTLDVDSAFTGGHLEPSAVAVAVLILAAWLAVYARLVVVLGRPAVMSR